MDTQKRAISELSIDTQTLERLLTTVPIGQTISYDALSASIGRNVQHDARGNLRTARKRLLRLERMLFGSVVNEGLKRLDDKGKVSDASLHIRRSHTQAKLAVASATSVDNFAALPNDVRITHNIVLAQAGVIKSMTSGRTRKRLETSLSETKPRLSLRESLDLMKPAI
jgi:hypothetical protein